MISKMKHFRLSIGVLSLLLTVSVFAQNRSGKVVTGIVYEGDTETPLEAVVCTAEPSGAYAVTGADGRFSISVAKADNLIRFSLLGYTESAIPASGTDVVVRLYEDKLLLDELVVVGYGTQRKSDITGAVGSVSRDRIESNTVTDVAQMIQGSVPGLTVMTTEAGANPEGQSGLMLIRGRNSISASNDPLLILDGVPYYGSVSDIATVDVESIEVLKDASAAAIYGSRASNGVILINTRKGSEGKASIRYNGYFSIQKVANYPDMMDGQDYYDFKKTWADEGDEDPEAFLSDSELAVYNDGSWKNWNWRDLITRTGYSTSHSVSASGGVKAVKYNSTVSYLQTKGIVTNDQYKKLSFRLNMTVSLAKWLTFNTSTQLMGADNSGASPRFTDAFNKSPLLRPFNEDGSINIHPDPSNEKRINPIESKLYDDENKSFRVATNNSLKATITKGLSYTLNTGYQRFFQNHNEYQGLNTAASTSTNGWGSMADKGKSYYLIENLVNFDREFGRHHLFLTLLYGYEYTNNRTKIIEGENFTNDLLSWYAISQAGRVIPQFDETDTSLISQMARLNYSYDSRYLLTATIRRDGYSGFGENNKWGIFPSVALGWNIANEPFFAGAKDVFNQLKLKLSYGSNGNQAISPFQSISKMTDNAYMNGTSLAVGYTPGSLGTPSLSWEKTVSRNAGLDFAMFSSRITGEFNVYYNESRDLLLKRSISPVNGITSIYQNIGRTDNRGVELSLTSTNISKKDFSWKTTVNLAYYKTRIRDLYGNQEDDIDNKWFIGFPVKTNFDYYITGVWQAAESASAAKYGAQPGYAKYDDVNNNFVYDAGDRQVIGSPEPDFTWSLNNTFTYRRFELSVYLYGMLGMVKANPFYAKNVYVKRHYWSADDPDYDYWSVNKNANQYIASKTITPSYYQKADFWRVKDLMLSYSLPGKVAGKLGMSGAKVYFNAKNLLTFTDYTGMDPELDEQRAKPLQREFVFGLNVNF